MFEQKKYYKQDDKNCVKGEFNKQTNFFLLKI